MSEIEVGLRSRRRSREEALALVLAYDASGLSRREFCVEQGLSVATLDLYRKRSRSGSEPSRLVAVEVEPSWKGGGRSGAVHPPLTVILGNGRRIEIGRSLDTSLLSEVIGVLERV